MKIGYHIIEIDLYNLFLYYIFIEFIRKNKQKNRKKIVTKL